MLKKKYAFSCLNRQSSADIVVCLDKNQRSNQATKPLSEVIDIKENLKEIKQNRPIDIRSGPNGEQILNEIFQNDIQLMNQEEYILFLRLIRKNPYPLEELRVFKNFYKKVPTNDIQELESRLHVWFF